MMNTANLTYALVLGAILIIAAPLSTQTIFAQGNQSQGAGQSQGNQSQGLSELALMALDFDGIESQLSDVNESILNNETITALNTLSEIQNQMIILDEEPQLSKDLVSIRDSLSNDDLAKATEDLTRIQNQITEVRNQYPELTNSDESSDDGE